ncbi:PAS domain-containing hybrid sensor histidine kinase/response regulator [Endozoicomonas sp. YOMI1]|uniref:PAS domain-containing hybrid sensor histidine kinase/response regulator n=1 Tax=Endozoicomonas sp. YOMI1 TaxID=2828739 RepID=UPI0021486428|nr:PAS domain-containing hybrid sensor histidine kinase/response regulator [Endozoicomonas sp. YOMI1]
MATSIRQKITLFNLLPAIVFYSIITFVFLYFTFRTASEEIGRRHLNETLRYAASVDTRISKVILAGRALSLSATGVSYHDLSAKVISIFRDMPYVKSVSIVDFEKQSGVLIKSKDSVYFDWMVKKFVSGDQGSDYSIPDQIYLSINNNLDYDWYVNTELTGSIFYTSFLVRVSDDSDRSRFLRLDLDAAKLVNMPINLDFRVRLIIADPFGHIVYANGISLLKYRTIEKFSRFGPCEGSGELYFPSENGGSFRHLLYSPVKPSKPDEPCGVMKDVLHNVVKEGRLVSVRILTRGSYKWSAAVPIKSTGWFFSYSIMETDIMKPVYKQAFLSASLIGLAMVLAIICLWGVSGRITRPLNELKREMNTFGFLPSDSSDNFQDSKDEAVSLNRSFIRLKERLLNREEALQKARAQNMASLVQQLRGRYFYFHLVSSGDITYVSPSITSVLGFTEDEFSGKIQGFLTDSVINASFRSVLKQLPKGVWQETFELEFFHKDGSIRCIEVGCAGHANKSSLTQKNTSQHLDSIECMGNDITHLVRDTEKFKALIAGSPDAIVITDTAGVINLANPRVEDLFRYHECDLLGLPLALLIDPEYRSDLMLLKELDSDDIDSHCLEARLSRGVDKYGHGFPVEISSNVLTTADGLLISIVFRDITQRKRIEGELLKAKETAEKASQAKSLFLSHISHELRTPLNGVLGYAQLLLADSDVPDKYRESLSSLEACGLHLLTMINDILDITKIESGIVRTQVVPFNIRVTLDMVFANFRETAKAKGLNLLLDILPNVELEIVGDNVKLRQVLINLIGNAVKFTDSGSVYLKVFVKGEKLQFEVLDSGVGIVSSDLAQLFQPFTQLKKGQECGGAGLGLSISYRLVEAMGGELQAESEPGKGSRFYFSIPYQVSQGESRKVLADSTPGNAGSEINPERFNKRQILVVDDSINNRDMLVKALKSKSFHVEAAEGGFEAVEKCRTTRYDLILMDLRMPGLDGFDAARAIHRIGRQQSIKIMAVSASVSEQTRVKIADSGFCDFIAKPVRFDELFNCIYHHLENDDGLPSDLPLSDSCQKEMVTALKLLLEIGDLKTLEEKAEGWSLQPGYGNVPEKVIELCKLLDVMGLETLYNALLDHSGS